jgi:BirA family transcriptional regulator, biotin operon repressor / biotin---[acetyl-CoA-carboxylase] ligase
MRCRSFENIIKLGTVDSTNIYSKKHINSLLDGTVVCAEEQTSGRGRLERKWLSEKGKGIYSSFIIKNVFDNADAVRLSFLFSIAVKNFLSEFVQYKDIRLKWPNDVLINNKKICGILSEYSKESVIAGVGINLKDFSSPEEIDKPWTCLEKECGKECDPTVMTDKFVASVNTVFARFCTNSLSEIPLIWFREAGIKGIKIRIENGNNHWSGTVEGIDPYGALTVKETVSKEIKTVAYGDIIYNDQL